MTSTKKPTVTVVPTANPLDALLGNPANVAALSFGSSSSSSSPASSSARAVSPQAHNASSQQYKSYPWQAASQAAVHAWQQQQQQQQQQHPQIPAQFYAAPQAFPTSSAQTFFAGTSSPPVQTLLPAAPVPATQLPVQQFPWSAPVAAPLPRPVQQQPAPAPRPTRSTAAPKVRMANVAPLPTSVVPHKKTEEEEEEEDDDEEEEDGEEVLDISKKKGRVVEEDESEEPFEFDDGKPKLPEHVLPKQLLMQARGVPVTAQPAGSAALQESKLRAAGWPTDVEARKRMAHTSYEDFLERGGRRAESSEPGLLSTETVSKTVGVAALVVGGAVGAAGSLIGTIGSLASYYIPFFGGSGSEAKKETTEPEYERTALPEKAPKTATVNPAVAGYAPVTLDGGDEEPEPELEPEPDPVKPGKKGKKKKRPAEQQKGSAEDGGEEEEEGHSRKTALKAMKDPYVRMCAGSEFQKMAEAESIVERNKRIREEREEKARQALQQQILDPTSGKPAAAMAAAAPEIGCLVEMEEVPSDEEVPAQDPAAAFGDFDTQFPMSSKTARTMCAMPKKKGAKGTAAKKKIRSEVEEMPARPVSPTHHDSPLREKVVEAPKKSELPKQKPAPAEEKSRKPPTGPIPLAVQYPTEDSGFEPYVPGSIAATADFEHPPMPEAKPKAKAKKKVVRPRQSPAQPKPEPTQATRAPPAPQIPDLVSAPIQQVLQPVSVPPMQGLPMTVQMPAPQPQFAQFPQPQPMVPLSAHMKPVIPAYPPQVAPVALPPADFGEFAEAPTKSRPDTATKPAAPKPVAPKPTAATKPVATKPTATGRGRGAPAAKKGKPRSVPVKTIKPKIATAPTTTETTPSKEVEKPKEPEKPPKEPPREPEKTAVTSPTTEAPKEPETSVEKKEAEPTPEKPKEPETVQSQEPPKEAKLPEVVEPPKVETKPETPTTPEEQKPEEAPKKEEKTEGQKLPDAKEKETEAPKEMIQQLLSVPARTGDLVQDLINEERFAEAIACKKHLESTKLLEQKEEELTKASAGAESSDDAFAIRAEVKALRATIQPKEVVEKWEKSDASETIGAALHGNRVGKHPEPEVVAFWNKSRGALLRIAQKNLESALTAKQAILQDIMNPDQPLQ